MSIPCQVILPFLFAVLAAVFHAPSANAQTRHALVISIDDYHHVTPLHKARNDARAVGRTLEVLGFRVSTLGHLEKLP